MVAESEESSLIPRYGSPHVRKKQILVPKIVVTSDVAVGVTGGPREGEARTRTNDKVSVNDTLNPLLRSNATTFQEWGSQRRRGEFY